MTHTYTVEEVRKHVRVYLTVFGALAVLTIVTVAVGHMHLPILPALFIGLLIASIKAGLVAAYFMHLVSERKVIFGVLIMTGIFLLCMVMLFLSAHADQEGGLVVA